MGQLRKTKQSRASGVKPNFPVMKNKKTLGLFASNSSMVTVLRATYSAQKPKNTKFNSNFFGLALNNRLMAYEYVCTYSTYGRPTTTQFQLSTKTYTKM